MRGRIGRTTLVMVVVGLAAGLKVGPANGGEGKPEPVAVPGGIPLMVVDEAAGNWVVDRFAGNSTAGYAFSQGPAAEAGGIGRPAVAVAPDGNVYLATGGMSWVKDIIVRVSPDGTLRLLAGGGSSLADGPAATARIAVDWRGGGLAWSEKDKSLYFVHATIPAVRRLYRKDGQWFVENAAGNPEKAGAEDGPAKTALFGEPRSLVVTSAGTIYVLDGKALLRKIEGGVVSTVAKFPGGREIVDGPLDKATFSITNMSGQIAPGEDDNVLYVADHWHYAARRIDLKTMTVSTVTVSENRDNRKEGTFGRPAHADGPAMTHATFNSGLAYVCYDPVHKALWVGGPDEHRMRWIRDGWVKTVIGHAPGQWPADGMATPAGRPRFTWGNVAAVDPRGRVYITTPDGGVWRAYNGSVKSFMKDEGRMEGWKTGKAGFSAFMTRQGGGREQMCRSEATEPLIDQRFPSEKPLKAGSSFDITLTTRRRSINDSYHHHSGCADRAAAGTPGRRGRQGR